MKTVKNNIPFITGFIMLWSHGYMLLAQTRAGDIVKQMDQAGFENVRASTCGSTLTLSYENNLYRDKAKAMAEVLNILEDCGYDTLNVLTLVNDLPVIITRAETAVWQQSKAGLINADEASRQFKVSFDTYAAWKSFRNVIPVNPNVFKVDLVVYPQFYLMNVVFSQNYEVQFNLAPAMEVSLWRGLKFTGQVILPVFNDKLFGSEGSQVRAGFVTLAQEFLLPGNIFGRAVIGKFNAGRYGADITLTRYFFSGQGFVSANAGYTGSHRFYGNSWFRDELNTPTGFLKAGYFYKRYNLQLDMTASRYINGDLGLRGDCSRYWGETVIGFYAMVAGGKFNGGFQFTVPLWPKKYKKNRYFQLRTPYYFDWEYNAGTEFYNGQYYETRPNENRAEYFYNPDFLIKKLLK